MHEEALTYALRVLARRRHTTAQLAQKLFRRHYGEETVNVVLAYCRERKYLDDEEFARLWVEDRIRLKPMGRWRLQQELGRKGVPADVIERVLAELLPEERELALAKQLLAELLARGSGDEPNAYRTFSYLSRRGFSRQVIRQGARELGLIICDNDQT